MFGSIHIFFVHCVISLDEHEYVGNPCDSRWQLVDLNAINWISLSVSCSQLSISSCDKIASLQSDIGKRAFIFLKMVSTVAVVVDNNHLLLFTFGILLQLKNSNNNNNGTGTSFVLFVIVKVFDVITMYDHKT